MQDEMKVSPQLRHEATEGVKYVLRFHELDIAAFDIDDLANRVARSCMRDGIPVEMVDMLDDDLFHQLIEHRIELSSACRPSCRGGRDEIDPGGAVNYTREIRGTVCRGRRPSPGM
ncbi:hypothetical protein [Rhodococcus pyridinivorans]|nr:hypothetical protein [Rhodococcus pyridinivorans]